MSDEFSKKLEAYEKGELTGKELDEFEEELEKLEAYQRLLEEDNSDAPMIHNKKQKKIIRKGKWKARIQTAITAVGIIAIIIFVSSTLTGFYYSWGKMDRVDEYRAVINHTLTITDPYGYLGGTSTSTNAFFGLEATRDLKKKVGTDVIKVGELEINFLFSHMSMPEIKYMGKISENKPIFYHPDSAATHRTDWVNQLEELPEGTVASAYVSFTELMESKQVEELFSDKEMDLLWLGVDTGITFDRDYGLIFDPIGFPSIPIWHADDFENNPDSTTSYQEGEQDKLHQQFMKTLYFLQKHSQKANLLSSYSLQLKEQIDYIEKNGILHYGAVVTGPTKELLKLQDDPSVRGLEVDEVEFWNWE